jgi:hypothetical protein
MSVYKVTIQDEILGIMSGEFAASSSEEAEKFAKEYYSEQLGTYEQEIEILETKQL